MATKSRKRAPVRRLPKAAQLEVSKADLDVRDRLNAVEHNIGELHDKVAAQQGVFADAGRRLAQVEGSADYWAGVSQRVKKLEDEKQTPTTTIVEQASGMSIAWCLLINDLIFGAVIGAWWYWPKIAPLFDVAKH